VAYTSTVSAPSAGLLMTVPPRKPDHLRLEHLCITRSIIRRHAVFSRPLVATLFLIIFLRESSGDRILLSASAPIPLAYLQEFI